MNVRVACLAVAMMLLAGCGWFDRKVASVTGFSRSCVDGVEYLQFASGVTVAYNRDGSVKSCGASAQG